MSNKDLVPVSLVTDLRGELLIAASLNVGDSSQFEVVETSGATKWVDLQQFLDQSWSGKAFSGYLMARRWYMDQKEMKRHYYLLQLTSPCPVSFKDEHGESISWVAQVGEVVALGERTKLEILNTLLEQGGIRVVVIRPNAPIAINRGQTMWTFDIAQRLLQARTESAPETDDAAF
jgi:hypothetical protein